MAIKVQGQTVVGDDRKGSFQVSNPGSFTTAQRDALTPVVGDTIFNINDGALQIWDGTEWGSAGGSNNGSAPALNSITLSENEPGNPRFTDQTFTSTVDMFQEGQPVSTKSIKAKVVAEFPVYPETNPIDSVTINTTSDVKDNTVLQSTSNPACVFNFVDPASQKLECFTIKIQDNSTVQLAKATDLKITSFDNVGQNPNPGSPYAEKACIAYTTPDEKYVLIQQAAQGQGLYVEAANFINGSYNVTYNYKVEVGKYKLRIGSGGSFGTSIDLSEKRPDGTFASRGSKNLPGYGTWNWTQATVVGDRVVITCNVSSSANSIYICNLTQAYLDSWVGGGNIPVAKTLNTSATRKQCEHKGKLFISSQNNLFVYNLDSNVISTLSKPPTPSSFNYAGDAIFEDPYGFLIMKMAFSASGVITYRYFKSNNAGVTWTTSPEYPDLSTGSGNGPNESRQATDCYQYGYRLAIWVSADIQTSYRRYLMGYQEVTIANSPDLSSINVGDLLRPSGVSNPRNYMLVDQITPLGNGNTTLKLTGFTTLTQGQLLTTTASIGNSELTKWLVISESSGLITDMTENEPAFVDIGPSTTVPITFPATFPSNKTPDEELPIGTTIQTYVKTENAAGASQGISNVLLPATTEPVPTFGLSAFSIVSSGNPDLDWNLWNDSQENISNTPGNLVDQVWKELTPWKNKTTTGPKQSFFVYKLQANLDKSLSLTFSGDNLEDKILELYMACTKTGSQDYFSDIQSGFTGCTVFNNQNLYWNNADNGSPNVKVHRMLCDGSNNLDLTIKVRAQETNGQSSEWMSLAAYRLTDISGNEITTEYP